MLETLAGRLKWERTPSGICVEMSPPLNRSFIGVLALRSYLIALILVFSNNLVESIFPYRGQTMLGWSRFLIYGTAYLAVGCLDEATTRKTLTLNSSELIVKVRSLFGAVRRRRVFEANKLNDLRFVAYSKRASVKNEHFQNEIQVDKDYETQSFFAGVTEEEATALIARMMDVYPFPKDPSS